MTRKATANQMNKLRETYERSVVYTTLVRLCAAVAFLAVSLIAIGSYISLSTFYTPWIAGSIVGGAVLVILLIVTFIAWYTAHPEVNTRQAPPAPDLPAPNRRQVDAISSMGEHLGASLNNSQLKTIDVLIAALVAGTVLGASPALRHRLFHHHRRSTDTDQLNK